MLEIITDSASDLPLEIREYYHLHVIPTPVVIDGVDYLDGKTLKPSEFYEIQQEGGREISTYHINPDMFEQAFRGYAKDGVPVLYVCFSTGIAATWNAAHIAKENLLEKYPRFDLTIVDSRCASAGFGLLVYYLLRLREKGADRETLVGAAEFYRDHIRHVFTVDTLEYLIKGGRITKTKGLVAETLAIRPVITVDEHGSLKIMKLVRGTKKALRCLAEYVVSCEAADTGPEASADEAADMVPKTEVNVTVNSTHHRNWLEEQPVAFCHGTMPEAVGEVQELIQDRIGTTLKRPMVFQVGCAIGAHTGGRIVGICFLDTEDKYGAFSETVGTAFAVAGGTELTRTGGTTGGTAG